MGNVDLLNIIQGEFTLRWDPKKWYFRLFCHLVDMTVIIAWLLYWQGCANKWTIYWIGRHLELCKLGPHCAPRGRPQSSDPVEEARKRFQGFSLPTKCVWTHLLVHWPLWKDKKITCKHPNCKGYTYGSCEKYEVNLCHNRYKNCWKKMILINVYKY